MDEKEILRARLLATPRVVVHVVVLSVALAILIAVRVLWTYQQSGKPLGRGLEFAGLMGFAIVSSSLSLFNKNKFGYLLVLLSGFLPLLGSFALSLHAFRLLTLGNFEQDQIGLVTSLIGLLQFVTILALLTTLLRRETRNWIWRSNFDQLPSAPGAIDSSPLNS